MSRIFRAKVRKVGNSFGILIPGRVRDSVGIKLDDVFNFEIKTKIRKCTLAKN